MNNQSYQDYKVKGEKGFIRKSLHYISHMVRDYKYPGVLPKELEPFHVYITDCGHCIMGIPNVLRENTMNFLKKLDKPVLWDQLSTDDVYDYEVPVPVKYVLTHGFKVMDGYVWLDVPYDETFGADVDEEYEEYEEYEGLCDNGFFSDSIDNGFSTPQTNLPALTGSEEQVKLATIFRQRFINDFENYIFSYSPLEPGALERVEGGYILIEYILRTYTSASFYIDEYNESISLTDF